MGRKILASFAMTEFSLMRKHWERNSILKSNQIVGTNKPIGRDVDLGGIFVEINWDENIIQKSKQLSCPSGFDFWDNDLVIASMRKNEIYFMDKNLNLLRVASNKLFNDIHSIFITPQKTILVSSTGIDAVLEVDSNGNILWSWFACDNGYAYNQFGVQRFIDKNIDHRPIDYPTLCQSTHLNSVVQHPIDQDLVYASLFHQGSIIEINKTTNKQKVIFSGLKNCHSLQITNQGFIVADTNGGKVILFDKNFNVEKILKLDVLWIQDAFLTSMNTLLVSDADNCRILEVDLTTNRNLFIFKYPKEWRIYQVKEH